MRSPGSHNSAVAAHAYFTPSLSFETPFAKFFCSKDWSSTAVEAISEQLLDMTSLISNFSQLSPIAMFIMDAKDGSLLFANEAWTRITGGTIDEHSNLRWLDCLIDEDREFVAEQWCKTLWRPKVPDPSLFGENEVYYTWGECSAVPRLNANGEVEHVVGCLSDVTHIKWATQMQERRLSDAVKEKKEREEFMNMTSHELMNPLSAAVQAAHTMISSLDEINKALSHTHDNQKLVEDARMMSKLDINLFLISPTRTEPIRVVDTAMSMLSGETSKLDISIRLEVDPSMEALSSQWLCFDPSRFLQLLLNLLTNANQYAKSSKTRNVVVRLGATTGSPYHKEMGREIQYIPLRTARSDPTLKDASGTGEIVYLHCSITDTGKGLSETERQTLFKKFSQTHLSTHTKYGDSSLGLFICRELAELQGGAIGIGYADSQATAELPQETSTGSSQLEDQSSMGDFDVGSDTDVISMSELEFSEPEMTDSEALKCRNNGHIHSTSFP
ncbi:hsp90-like protein [Botrytis cinerea]